MSRTTAKVFMSGRSQALRLPKAFNFASTVREVYIEKEGEKVIISPKPTITLDSFFDAGPCPEFELDRTENQLPQEREELF
ncbi:hypothetical protein AGMMS50276_33380 [Synergistales bacterium]|nr:hypothetical protein AGMMS50276_33380 [Synergistales bacterium]